jgi:hypothetical protein
LPYRDKSNFEGMIKKLKDTNLKICKSNIKMVKTNANIKKDYDKINKLRSKMTKNELVETQKLVHNILD